LNENFNPYEKNVIHNRKGSMLSTLNSADMNILEANNKGELFKISPVKIISRTRSPKSS
jgi:hypothetical protein